MAIEKPMTPSNVVTISTDDNPELEVEVIDPDAVTVTDDDGSVAIVLDDEMQEEIVGPDHSSNLAEYLDEGELESMASDLISSFESDRKSRRGS